VTTQAARPYGPSAFGGSVRRFVELTLTLARSEFKLRYFGSALGYAWSLMRPLMFFTVLYLFFTKAIRIKGGPHYGVYLLVGIVFWTYFAEATSTAVTCMVAREGLLRKVRFPRMVVPLSVSLTSTFNLAMNFIAVFVWTLASGVSPRVGWLELIPTAIGFIVLASGMAMLLSVLYVRFRDVAPIWDVTLQIWFYASPIMYLAKAYGEVAHPLQKIMMINPVATLLTQESHDLIGGAYRSATARAGAVWPVIIALAIIPAVFALGLWVFTREAPRIAEEL
jgi:ABC-2 type transport system permease protein